MEEDGHGLWNPCFLKGFHDWELEAVGRFCYFRQVLIQ